MMAKGAYGGGYGGGAYSSGGAGKGSSTGTSGSAKDDPLQPRGSASIKGTNGATNEGGWTKQPTTYNSGGSTSGSPYSKGSVTPSPSTGKQATGSAPAPSGSEGGAKGPASAPSPAPPLAGSPYVSRAAAAPTPAPSRPKGEGMAATTGAAPAPAVGAGPIGGGKPGAGVGSASVVGQPGAGSPYTGRLATFQPDFNPYGGGGIGSLLSGTSLQDYLNPPPAGTDRYGNPINATIPGALAGPLSLVPGGSIVTLGGAIGGAGAQARAERQNEIATQMEAGTPGYSIANVGMGDRNYALGVTPSGRLEGPTENIMAAAGLDSMAQMSQADRDRLAAEVRSRPDQTFGAQVDGTQLDYVRERDRNDPSDRQGPPRAAPPAAPPAAAPPAAPPPPGVDLASLFNVDTSGQSQAYLDMAGPALQSGYGAAGMDLDYVLRRTGQRGTPVGQGLQSELADILAGAEQGLPAQAQAYQQQYQQQVEALRSQFLARLEAGEDVEVLAAEAEQALAALQGQQPAYADPFAEFQEGFASIPINPQGAGVYLPRYG